MKFVYDNGGQVTVGIRSRVHDCVIRAIAIATQLPYGLIYFELARLEKQHAKQLRHDGIPTQQRWFRDYMASLGYKYVSLYQKGVKLDNSQLPDGRIIVHLTKRYSAVIHGELHDIENCQRTTWVDAFGQYREDIRSVRGYWQKLT